MQLICSIILVMKMHELQLAATPFNAIVQGKKTIESRLYDEKRRLINVGDTIVFTNRDEPSKQVTAKVTSLLRYATFKDMFAHQRPELFGGPDVTWLLNQINEFYSEADQERWGVVGIQFTLFYSTT